MSFRLIIFIFWLPQALAQLLTWTYWWQVKEYRFDRMKVLLRSKTGLRKLEVASIFFKLLFIAFSPMPAIPLILFLYLDALFFGKLIQKNLRRPVFTRRAVKMLLISTVGIVMIFATSLAGAYRFETALWFSELFLIIGPTLGILITKSLVERIKKEETEKAEKKLKKNGVKTIGITGSYGKTTTKEFVAALLSTKYKVEKTKENQNSEFGVARKVINDLKKSTQVFVAEMGAYTRGDIRNIASFTHPEVGMITGLEPQHLELFGSLENVMKAKFELIESLPKGGLAFFNTSNKECEKLAKRAEKLDTNLLIKRYKLVSEFSKRSGADAESKIIKQEKSNIKFVVRIQNQEHELEAPLNGAHFVENLTGAILLARELEVEWKAIKESCNKINTPKGTMQTFRLANGGLLIDDTYNSTPRGFTAALNFLASFKDKNKVVITSGIIELGAYTHIVHVDLGKLMAEACDVVILTNPDFAADIRKGLGNQEEKLILAKNVKNQLDLFKSINASEAVILLEGRMSSQLVNYIYSFQK